MTDEVQPGADERQPEAERAAQDSGGEGYRPELPDWGVYLRWPTEGEGWIHEDDLQLALSLIPSDRVFCRYRWEEPFYWLKYGEAIVRVQPTLWVSVAAVDLEVGEQVEVLHRFGDNDPGVFELAEIRYLPKRGQVIYQVRRGDLLLPHEFSREDLKPLQERHALRTGYYEHLPPKLQSGAESETLDVGNLLDQPEP